MKFRIAEAPEEKLRSSDAIPIEYCNKVYGFSKLYFRSSTFIDIISNEYTSTGYTLRLFFFFVKKPVMLLTSISSSKLSITSLLQGNNLSININELNKVKLDAGEYCTFLQNKDELSLSLYPGMYKLVRCDYDVEKVSKYSKEYSFYDEWVELSNFDKSQLVDQGHVTENLLDVLNTLGKRSIKTVEDHNIFFEDLRYILSAVLNFKENKEKHPNHSI